MAIAHVPQFPQIIRAIKERRLILINYAPGTRLIAPHVYGIGRNGTELVRGYQLLGSSATHRPKDWKMFDCAKITGFPKVASERFEVQRDYVPFDRWFKEIFAQVKN